MNYGVGDHVVCVNGKFHPMVARLYKQCPVEGDQYVVRDIRLGIRLDCKTGDASVLLVGVVNPRANSKSALERGFRSDRFMPLQEWREAVRAVGEIILGKKKEVVA